MKTVLYKLDGVDDTITQVTKVDFTQERGKAHIVSLKSGKHVIPLENLVSID